MASSTRHHRADAPEQIGAMLSRLRLACGWSQMHLAERLCAASGTPTVSRHEVSRWERGERIPGSVWLGWLAVVLETPLGQLEAVVAATGRPCAYGPRGEPDHHRLWRPPTAADLLAALDHASTYDVPILAHAWLAGPLNPQSPEPAPGARRAVLAGSDPTGASAGDSLRGLEARLSGLRRLDDQFGGLDLSGQVDRELRAAVAMLRTVDGGLRPRAMRVVAGYAQLAGWVHADAGEVLAARRAYRVALRAAAAAGERSLAVHVLGALSHQSLAAGDPHQALMLARTGYAGARAEGSPLTRALLLHRVALAAAWVGDRQVAEPALAHAERVVDRSRPEQEPAWLYWLDEPEFAAMTGRCLAVLGRPLRAARLLSQPRTSTGPRTATLYATWLARSYLALGEVELACRIAIPALTRAAFAGSARATAGLRHLHALLLHHRDVPMVRKYAQVAARAFGPPPETRRRARHGSR